MGNLVAVEPLHEFLPGVDDDLTRDWDVAEPVDGPWIEFKSALVFELLEDVLLNLLDAPLRVDEMVMKDLLERPQRVHVCSLKTR